MVHAHVIPLGGDLYWCPEAGCMVKGKTEELAQLRAELMVLKKLTN